MIGQNNKLLSGCKVPELENIINKGNSFEKAETEFISLYGENQ